MTNVVVGSILCSIEESAVVVRGLCSYRGPLITMPFFPLLASSSSFPLVWFTRTVQFFSLLASFALLASAVTYRGFVNPLEYASKEINSETGEWEIVYTAFNNLEDGGSRVGDRLCLQQSRGWGIAGRRSSLPSTISRVGDRGYFNNMGDRG